MLGISFASVELTFQRPAIYLDHGTERADYSDLTPVKIPNCIIQPAGTVEDLDSRDFTSTTRLIHADLQADIQRLDLVEIPGERGTFRVDAEPVPWHSPTGSLGHLEVTATRYTEGVV